MAEQLNIRELFNRRIKFYGEISEQPDVWVQEFKVYGHKNFPESYFINIKYQMREGENFSTHDEIETFVTDRGWITLDRELTPFQKLQFLKDCEEANFDIGNVKIQ